MNETSTSTTADDNSQAVRHLALAEQNASTAKTGAPDESGASSPAPPAPPAPDNSTRPSEQEYRQRPMPAGAADSDAKIGYDRQHELQTASSTVASNLTVGAGALDTAGQRLQSYAAAAPPAGPSGGASDGAEAAGSAGAQVATGELIVHDGADESAGSRAPLGPLVGADEPASLDPAAASSAVSVSRHGRASPPASSRLSAYTPTFSLQNSRSHPHAGPQYPEEPIGATPLQLSGPTPPASPRPDAPFDPIIVCYLGSWSTYRPSLAKFTPENINPFLCTHIIYAFAGLSSKYELKPFDSYNDITQGGYRKFTSLKEHNKQLKTLIAVGGWNEGSAR